MGQAGWFLQLLGVLVVRELVVGGGVVDWKGQLGLPGSLA